MAHKEQRDFCLSVREKYPEFFCRQMVLDIGSLDLNGNNGYLFEMCLYMGVDLAPGRNVDIVSKGHELALPDETFDCIISTECFEHDCFYPQTLQNIIRMLKPGGLFLFSCATTGRSEHGTRRTSPSDAPLLMNFDEWSNYYKNLTEDDIRSVLEVDGVFKEYQFSINSHTHDLYFYGIKRGGHVLRDDYSFLIRPKSIALSSEIEGELQSLIEKLSQSKN